MSYPQAYLAHHTVKCAEVHDLYVLAAAKCCKIHACQNGSCGGSFSLRNLRDFARVVFAT